MIKKIVIALSIAALILATLSQGLSVDAKGNKPISSPRHSPKPVTSPKDKGHQNSASYSGPERILNIN